MSFAFCEQRTSILLHFLSVVYFAPEKQKDHLGTTNNGAQAVGFSSQNVLPVVNSTIRQSHATLLLYEIFAGLASPNICS